jgi:signal transduction histidine kinase
MPAMPRDRAAWYEKFLVAARVPATIPKGTGLQGMADRLGALGGSIDITSAPGHGTQVTGRVPTAAA